jgi:hypothetical protein
LLINTFEDNNMLHTSVWNEQRRFRTLTKRKIPKSKIKMKMGTNVRKDVTQRKQHGRTITKSNHGKAQIE